jgi:outer membrane lipoprotein-sorting protein
MVAATGWAPSQLPADAVVTGTFIRMKAGTERTYPATLKIKGPRRFRSEAENGHVTIVNGDQAAIFSAEGANKQQGHRALSIRPLPLPFFSELATAAFGQYGIRYLGTEEVRGEVCEELLIEFHPDGASGANDIRRRVGRVRLWVSQTTYLPVQMELVRLAETNPTVSMEYLVRYSDYRLISGLAVPYRHEEYVHDRLRYRFQISDVQFNVGLQDSEFAIPTDLEAE